MKHKFRKYISNRGSALFLVLSVMTSLIVTCMAMYFSVVSSRKTQYAVFNQQQAYQSALSLNESILGAIYSGLETTDVVGFKKLSEAVFKLTDGESVTTNGNGFKSFGASDIKADESQIGAYTATITKIGGDLYDVSVTAMVNGSEAIVHQYVNMAKGSETPPFSPKGKPPLFTASGLVPTNSSIGMGGMYADVFYDSEFTDLMPYGDMHGTNAQMKILGNLYAAGSLSVNCNISSTYQQYEFATKPRQWYIRKDLIMSNEKLPVNFPPEGIISGNYDDKTNVVIVGGDLKIKSDSKGFSNCTIYVLGDLYVESGGWSDGASGTNVNIYVSGTIHNKPGKSGVTVTTGLGGKNAAALKKDLYSWTADVKYYDWNSAYGVATEVEVDKLTRKLKIKKTAPIPGINEKEDLYLTTSGTTWTFDGSKAVTDVVNGNHYYGRTINSVSLQGGGDYENGYGSTFYIDTGSDPKNIFVIKLTGYLDKKTVNGKDYGTFSWAPNYGQEPVWVIVKGQGSVVFEVPEGVTYENRSMKTTVMQEGWYNTFRYHGPKGEVGKTLMPGNYIHHGCDDNCCENILEPAYEDAAHTKPKTCMGTDENGNVCGLPLFHLQCSDHNLDQYVCKKCDQNAFNYRVKADGKEYSYGTCEYRVNPDTGGSYGTPTTNVFLVMCGTESRLLATPDKQHCNNNGISEQFSSFWGYIYAPYTALEYTAGLSGGDRIQFVGGICVAEFNLNEYHPYVAAYPTMSPNNVMPTTCQQHELMSIDGKPWKTSGSNNVSA